MVGFWDAVAFDEVAGIMIRDPDAIQIMKDYLAEAFHYQMAHTNR